MTTPGEKALAEANFASLRETLARIHDETDGDVQTLTLSAINRLDALAQKVAALRVAVPSLPARDADTDLAARVRDLLYETRRMDGPTIWELSQRIAALPSPAPASEPECDFRDASGEATSYCYTHDTTHRPSAPASGEARRCDFDCSYCADPLPDDPGRATSPAPSEGLNAPRRCVLCGEPKPVHLCPALTPQAPEK